MRDDVTAEEFLRRAFEVIVSEAEQNKRFAKQLLSALGAKVVARDLPSPRLYDPRVELQSRGREQTATMLSKMTVGALKQICDQFGYDYGSLPATRKQPYVNLIISEAQAELDRR